MGQYEGALERLKDAAQIVTQMADRLIDSEDGLTQKGVGLISKDLDKLDPQFAEQISGYLFAMLKYGGTVDPMKGTVLIPPCTREKFEIELSSLPKEASANFDFAKWLDHLYDPVPRVTEGFYLFESKGDWGRFEASLGKEHADTNTLLHVTFDKLLHLLPEAEGTHLASMDMYVELSQRVMEMQKKVLEPVLAEDQYARGMSTRVRIKVDEDGKVSLSTTHYTEEFKDDLAALAAKLREASDTLPDLASELRMVLNAHADWCEAKTTDPDWGRSSPTWVNAKDPSNLIDVNVTAEEKVSHIGQKGIFHMQVTQHVDLPESLSKLWGVVQEQASREHVSMLALRTLVVGGHTVHMTIAGEKLPDPAGEPLYKSMIFTNALGDIVVRSSGPSILSATGIDVAAFPRLSDAVTQGIIQHEYGHTKGDHAKFLEQYGGFVEETNAQGCALYDTMRNTPDMIQEMILFESLWMPIRRARSGILEQHSRSDLVLLNEYLKAGALEIVEKDGRHIVQLRDQNLLLETAFQTATKMRLWEKGIPSRPHSQFTEPFDSHDSGQDARITKAGVEWFGDQEQAVQARLKQETFAEAEAFFSEDKMREIGKKIQPILNQLRDIPQPMAAIIPGDKRMSYLVA